MGAGSSKDEANTSKNGVSGQSKSSFVSPRDQGHVTKSNSDGHHGKRSPKVENNNTKSSSKPVTTKFTSDSDSEDELDTKRRGNSRTVSQNNSRVTEHDRNGYNTQTSRNSETPHYPESYAQRNLRQQYTKNEQLLRQKTIYRDPDEWQMDDEVSIGSFDVSKFKQANKGAETKKDMFAMTPDYTTRPMISSHDNAADHFYEPPRVQKQTSVPKYDITEEELMADIEKEFAY
ncbi:hypothetical protein FSP39_006749 [Pinctada imbricata]|uniref:Uncharacterized protein n=1 Tax=Pinctada imbricata TaxID=66713 RepID=A0AA88XL88_PINIB|nr:hypothetical protein FSP39_006749 [Pinctada imbricata]